ncbi:RNA-binding domain-containing protein [Chryseobacterium turcicum]|uniref:DNA binding domain-containing protein n=1 Tax=Chryseobacterium turcicum TaxID=2898076 RepID=A0A9Q3UZH4_9FLAO|nr:RNA-binding domain-containing protein [Chryseobacterium turcicum]MCD1116763.1 putative DNA binding domain-containing protein [Chryseobacterium turcicum]
MNISLELISEEQILKIKNYNIKSETADLDYKEVFSIKDSKDKIEFVKDILAFANSKGGYIIYGVNNNAEWIGLDERSDDKIDEADLANIFDNFIDGDINILTNTVEIEGNYFFVIYIKPTHSKEILSFKKDGQYVKKSWGNKPDKNITIFRKGDVYCRRGSRSIKADSLFYRQKSNNFEIIENITSQPILYNEFIGRKEYLIDLDNKLNHLNNRIIQIDGIGGIGKTTFVHYYVTKLLKQQRSKRDYDFIIWSSSKRNKYTPNGIKDLTEYIANYKELISEIHQFIKSNKLIDESEEDEELETEEYVLNFLSNNKVLLVIDNLETLNDTQLVSFLEDAPPSLKIILTTRETLGDFYLTRINLHGFEEISEFPDFLNSQFKIFTGKDSPLFIELYGDHLSELYSYTKGMPLAGQLICHQLAYGTPINQVLNNLKNGRSYENILNFCFKGSIDKLSDVEKTLLYIFSLPEKEEFLSLDELVYISNYSSDQIGIQGIPNLTKMSLCYQNLDSNGNIGYSIPFLAKLYSKQYLNLENESEILANYENFIQEKSKFNSKDAAILNLIQRSKAKSLVQKVAATDALKALTLANYEYDNAILNINDLIEQNKNFAFLYLIKGKIEENGIFNDSYEMAKKEFKMAINIDEDFLEAYIELGYLEFKSRFGNPKNAKQIVENSIKFFLKAYELDNTDQRTCLGLAQAYTYQATKTNMSLYKPERLKLARKANEFFDKSYHNGDNLTTSQNHANAIAAFNHAINYRNNIRDVTKAIEICNLGLSYEKENIKLRSLKQELEDKIKGEAYNDNQKEYINDKLQNKGWHIKSN